MAQSLVNENSSHFFTPSFVAPSNATPSAATSCALSVPYSMELMRRPSITPLDEGCQDWLADKLSILGFECHRFNVNGVSNLVAMLEPKTCNTPQPLRTVAFAGHTDVVPPGDVNKWRVNPFSPQIQGDELIGRGAADMKTGVAAMLAATEQVLTANADIQCRYLWLITSDEEGEAEFGTKEIMAWLDNQNIRIDQCVVGEPTAKQSTGDAIKVGRRGAISARLHVTGKQGHVAYPQYADNAIHKMARVINALESIQWDEGSIDFPGSSLQITHIDSGAFTDNIVPANCQICFNIRYSHNYSQADLEALINQRVSAVTEQFSLEWERPCEPYFTANGASSGKAHCLITAVEQAIHKNTGSFPVLSTAGGTSDGRFIASEHTQVVEVGVPNKTIHQIDERINISDLVTLEDIYGDLLTQLLF